MDSAKPAHPRRLALHLAATSPRSARVANVVHARIRKHRFARQPGRAFLWVLFATISIPLPGADLYLPRFGPAPLRFATPPKAVDFSWPTPPTTSLAATNQPVVGNSSQENGTNPVPSAPVILPATNSPAGPETSVFPSPTDQPSVPAISDTNPFSASNLLIVTPQMLSEYFRGNFDGTFRPLTNGVAGPEAFFNPPYALPLLKPSSQATYRTQ